MSEQFVSDCCGSPRMTIAGGDDISARSWVKCLACGQECEPTLVTAPSPSTDTQAEV